MKESTRWVGSFLLVALILWGGWYWANESLIQQDRMRRDATTWLPPAPPEKVETEPQGNSFECEWTPNMSFVKFDGIEMSTMYTFGLGIYNLSDGDWIITGSDGTPPSVSGVYAGVGNARVGITMHGSIFSVADFLDPPADWNWSRGGQGNWSAEAQASVIAMAADIGVHGAHDVCVVACWQSYARVTGADPQPDDEELEYFSTGGWMEDDTSTWHHVGETSWELAGSFAIEDLKIYGEVTNDDYPKRQSPRSFQDRDAEVKWLADGTSTITATLGSLSATNPITWDGAGTIGMGIIYANSPSLNTDYGLVSDLTFSESSVSTDLSNISYWSQGTTPWVWDLEEPLTYNQWHAYGVGQTLHLQKLDATGSQGGGTAVECTFKGPIRFNIDAGRFGASSDAYPSGIRFSTGITYYDATVPETTTVWFPPGLSEWYHQFTFQLAGGAPPDVSGYKLPNSFYVKVDTDWADAANERLSITVDHDAGTETITADYAPFGIPSLKAGNFTDEPYWGPAIEMTHVDVNADVPPGESARPTSWAGAGGLTIGGADNALWTIADGAAAPAVTRTLATRYWLRMDRLASKPGPAENQSPAWVILQKANQLFVDDDPAWTAIVPVEDVTNYDNSTILRVGFAQMPQAAIGESVVVTLNYSTVVINDEFYASRVWRFGALSNWSYNRSTGSVSFSATVVDRGDGVGGDVYVDMCLPLNLLYPPCLQHVDSVSVSLPTVAGTWELEQYKLIADPSNHGYEDGYPHIVLQPAPDAWNWLGDYFGFGMTYEGKHCLNLVYGVEDESSYHQRERTQRGMKQHADLHQSPTFVGPAADWCYAKSLGDLIGELNYQEQWDATYNPDTNVTAATYGVDPDGNKAFVGSGPYWWDLERAGGDVIGDEASGGIRAALHVKTIDTHVAQLLPVTLYAKYHLHGRGHGIATLGNTRHRGSSDLGADSDVATDHEYVVWRIADSGGLGTPDPGAEWEMVGSCEPSKAGRFRTNPVMENGYDYAISYRDNGDKLVFSSCEYDGVIATREYGVIRVIAILVGGHLALTQHFSGAILVTDVGLTAPNTVGEHKIQRGVGWSQRFAVPDSADALWANILATNSRMELIEGQSNVQTRKAHSLDGNWQAEEIIEAGYTAPYGIEVGGRFYICAYKDGGQHLLRRDRGAGHASVGSPIVIADEDVDADIAACLAINDDTRRLAAAVQRDGHGDIYGSSDSGQVWEGVRRFGLLTYPYIFSDAGMLWVTGYSDNPVGTASGRAWSMRCSMRNDRITPADGHTWAPTGVYAEGRIDSYEGVDCSGECDQFTQRFWEEKFDVRFADDWWHEFAEQALWDDLPEGSTFTQYQAGDVLRSGDMLFFRITPTLLHAAILDKVIDGRLYVANSNHNWDSNGYYDIDPPWTLYGFLRLMKTVGAADEGRPAIIRNATTRELTVVVPKTTDWGLGEDTPAIVEYVSTDTGQTWTQKAFHGLT